MSITPETLFFFVLGLVATIVLGLIGYLIKAKLDDIRISIVAIFARMDGLMSKELCKVYHDGHNSAHLQIEKDMNGIGKKVEAIIR